MALQRQDIDIALGEGVQEGVGAKLLDAPKLGALVDARWNKRGEYAKRYGSTGIADTGITSTAEAHSLLEHNGALVALTSQAPYAWDVSTSDWRKPNAGGPRPGNVETDPAIRGNGSYRDADLAYLSAGTGLVCVVYRNDTDAQVEARVIDVATGSHTIFATAPSDIKLQPRVIAIGGTFMVFGLDAVNSYIHAAVLNASTGTFGTAVAINASPTNSFDVHIASGETTAHVVAAFGSSGWASYEVNASGTVVNTLVENTGREPTGIAILHNPTASRIYVLYDDLATTPNQLSIDYFADDYTGSATKTKVLDYEEAAQDDERRVTMGLKSSAAGTIWCFVSKDRSLGDVIGGVEFITVSSAGAPSGTKGFVPNLILATQATHDSEGRVIVGVSREVIFDLGGTIVVEPQPSGFLVTPTTLSTGDDSLAVIGRFGIDAIDVDGRGSLQTDTYVGSLEQVGSESWAPYTVLIASNPGAPNGALEFGYQWGIDILRAYFNERAERSAAEGLAVVAGGELACFDGQRFAELAIPVVPHAPLWADGYGAQAVGATAAPNDYSYSHPWVGSVAADQYVVAELAWRYAFRWIDAQGNVHRSSVSEELRRTNLLVELGATVAANIATADHIPAGAGADGLYDFNRLIFFPIPTLTALNGEVGTLQVELYRTDPIFRRYTWSAGTDTLNDTETGGASGDTAFRLVGVLDVGEVTGHPNLGYVEDPMDATASEPGTSSPSPYVDSSPAELASEPLPPVLDVCSTQQRLFVVDAEDRLSVRYSKPFTKGYAPEFNAALSIRCAAEGGDLVAIETLDDKLVCFKERRIYVTQVLGGLDATGSGTTFDSPREIASDVGCVSRASVAKGPWGVVFESARGIYLLGRDLSLTWIGEAVRDSFDGRTITAATVVPEQNEVRFSLDNDTALVWEYRLNQWSTWENLETVDACMWRGRWTRALDIVGKALAAEYEDDSTYDADDLTRPLLSVTTPWIKLAGLQGFKRIWRATFLGDYYSGHFKVEIGYDYETAYTDTHTIFEDDMAALPSLQLQFAPSRQKCQAIRFRVSEVTQGGDPPPSVTIGRGFVLQGLRLRAGLRPGTYKHLGSSAKR